MATRACDAPEGDPFAGVATHVRAQTVPDTPDVAPLRPSCSY